MEYRWLNRVLTVELCMSIIAFHLVHFTGIDWNAYMQEVKGFLDGELDYMKLKGDTGPLVYPGGFVWSHSALYFMTKGGVDVEMAQWLYLGIYVMVLVLVAHLYYNSGLRGRLFIRLLLSKRIRSLFMFRLFNDCWAMFLVYLSVICFARGRRWTVGCLLYSMAVSVKMNIFLFAPGLLLILCKSLPFTGVVRCLAVCALWQVVAGLPFLLHNPRSYIVRSFDLGRVFTYRWTVNFKRISEEIFFSSKFSRSLLVMLAVSWLLVCFRRWSKRAYRRGRYEKREGTVVLVGASDEEVFHNVTLTLMESNMIGVIFARSLHYQFFLWFFYFVPFVLSATRLPLVVKVVAFLAIQYGFEVYPSTTASSSVLLSGFLCVWLGMLLFPSEYSETTGKETTVTLTAVKRGK
ncbi:alpha-1,3-mannosyltransferase, putative [Trypanosoma brucei gambiense DAL972]|uniref:dolichyl-P-Man:Man5GlcNAc2-PP-dolichol alpha-1,3-mannosyltransferase n=1 Tax=Trypanosoma brucei gambiense (strain MHOM/CI/86/DAL972) TaxID=679716 RepID=D0A365_TRYB9|nr:alpha-1,3-mannosyltransferase, putative [Trypanosoma brucei gambiense DAL972]CBH15709.1 alpha-1,3-mannosyltransferase, putative [Trypanosoma brucei gambiense DAL972]|eukprot:XP_011777973.1 alpha-1,3-mannosyltransferase, putative [Trypanosoma brucei gambiense DAL972]